MHTFLRGPNNNLLMSSESYLPEGQVLDMAQSGRPCAHMIALFVRCHLVATSHRYLDLDNNFHFRLPIRITRYTMAFKPDRHIPEHIREHPELKKRGIILTWVMRPVGDQFTCRVRKFTEIRHFMLTTPAYSLVISRTAIDVL